MVAKKTNKTANHVPGDPTAVSLRVKDIDRIVQLHGSFERLPEQYETLVPTLHMPKMTAEVLADDQVSVCGDFAFEGRAAKRTTGSDPEPGPVVIRITARFAAFYRIDIGPKIPAESLESFAVLNGQLNIWPYWREYVQDCLVRVGMSVLTLPPFNPVRISKQLQEQESAESPTDDH